MPKYVFAVKRAGKKHHGTEPELLTVTGPAPAAAAEQARRQFRRTHGLTPQIDLVCVLAETVTEPSVAEQFLGLSMEQRLAVVLAAESLMDALRPPPDTQS